MAAAARKRAALTALAASLLFLLLAVDLLFGGPLSSNDVATSLWAASLRGPALTPFFEAISTMHSTMAIHMASAVLLLVLAARRHWHSALALLATVQGGMLLNAAMKQVFERSRPAADHALLHLETFSFPSGHAATATVWWGFIAMFVWSATTNRNARLVVAAVAVAMVALTCASRVYLGVHYLSDVMAGVAEGTAWVALCVLALRRRAP